VLPSFKSIEGAAVANATADEGVDVSYVTLTPENVQLPPTSDFGGKVNVIVVTPPSGAVHVVVVGELSVTSGLKEPDVAEISGYFLLLALIFILKVTDLNFVVPSALEIVIVLLQYKRREPLF